MLAGWPCLGHLLSRWLLDPPDLDPPTHPSAQLRCSGVRPPPTPRSAHQHQRRPLARASVADRRICQHLRSALGLATSRWRCGTAGAGSRNLDRAALRCLQCCSTLWAMRGGGGQAWASFFLFFGFISDWWRKCAACLLVSAVLYYARGGIMWPGSFVGKHFLYFQNSQNSKIIGQAHHPFSGLHIMLSLVGSKLFHKERFFKIMNWLVHVSLILSNFETQRNIKYSREFCFKPI